MDDFAKRSPQDRADLFRAVAAHRGLASSIIEPELREAFENSLEQAAGKTWSLDSAPEDPNHQTLLFRYPNSDIWATCGNPA